MAEQSISALASKIVDRWSWWRAALKNPAAIGKTLPVHDGDAQQGYYRAKNKDKTFDPVAIFFPEGSDDLVAYRSGREVRADEVWSFCCRYPVSFEAYTAATEGKGWPDDDATVAAQIKTPEPGIGDNSGEVDPIDALKDQIDAALKGLDTYKKIADDATAAKAQSLRNRLNELSGDADKKRDELKRPHLESGKAIDKVWMPIVKSAKEGANTVKASLEAWETEKLRRRREEERKADEARRAAEEAAREQQGETTVLEAPKVETQHQQPDTSAGQIRATYGKAASVTAKLVVEEVTDWPKLAVYMSGHPECQELLVKLAQRAIDAGRKDLPGVTTTERASVR
ncbi:hypothetical protein [Rhizobium rhizogenes]|uniref:hypothetical protein n=1 Tax=Rhizobium rhizogenes TaxID=359 RepID=UPI0004D9CE80|nr:hypothetical protein [Rhizobium rhizogenes]KEA07163.1 hypothetical protein CN09_09500 [Rhizobium rhizogenes]NTI80397.1 hypothetical protein [Rhizobium rhizogenes]NTJ22583.1 hypothetical protein [Rhizobium rhizogenes]QUE81289.1 hypothetical protein EML492_05635 [Rhizobium rhizogenes]TQO80612.1 hypothetical protein FFE80_05785 [Rhizobium rhizogenes]